jgi:hypothetical protein
MTSTIPVSPVPLRSPVHWTPEVSTPARTPEVSTAAPGRRRGAAGPRQRRQTESAEYAAMLERMLWAFGERVADDPAALTYVHHMTEVLSDAVNLGIYRAAHQPVRPYSLREMAAMLDVASKTAIVKRRDRGAAVHQRIETARSRGPLVRIADWRARRARMLAAAGVADVTGPAQRAASQ